MQCKHATNFNKIVRAQVSPLRSFDCLVSRAFFFFLIALPRLLYFANRTTENFWAEMSILKHDLMHWNDKYIQKCVINLNIKKICKMKQHDMIIVYHNSIHLKRTRTTHNISLREYQFIFFRSFILFFFLYYYYYYFVRAIESVLFHFGHFNTT